ncbi:MAG: flagellar hook-basal body complex protein FliE [Burkholderiales bacterium]|jgi:flagellar hook-basal body complex protein FliE|nr:flagellar hook-basal body complex protein FliE [Burkholderiales bacterium]
MDLRLTPTTMPVTVRPAALQRPAGSGATSGPEAGFSDALKSALQSVSSAQNQATRLQREVQMENPAVSLEETMVGIQKAQIGFQATLHVRNRMVQAYTDIMNMQV